MIKEFQGKYRFLSNFWPAVVVFEGLRFPTVEHAYQAAKSKDTDVWEVIRMCKTPGEAKKLGKHLRLRPDWGQVKLALMEDLVRQKFSSFKLGALLVATGDQEIIEGNDWGDVFWGVCRGKGENHLGKILMKVRKELVGGGV